MNEPIDDKAFEEYLKRGSPVSQQYQALDSDEIPADIDRQVLARAQEAVRAPVVRKTRAWQRWSVPVALAASAVLAVSIVIESGQHESALTRAPSYPAAERDANTGAPQADEREVEPRLAYEPPRPVATPSEATGSAPQDRPAAAPPRAQVDRPSEPRVAVQPRVEAFAKRAEAEAAEQKASADARIERARQRAAEELNDRAMRASRVPVDPVPAAPPPAAMQQAAPAASAAQAESSSFASERDPEEWLREIRELRVSGKAEEADREWKAFREAFPDHVVAEDDLAIGR